MGPGLKALQEELAQGKQEALKEFWEEIARKGAPLIEAIPGDDRFVLVTFLYRGKQDTKNVVLFAQLQKTRNRLEYLMTHLGDTDLWYLTFRMRKDLRLSYSFVTKIPKGKIGLDNIRETDPFNPSSYFEPEDEEDPNPNPLGGSILELPEAPPQPWIEEKSDVPKGRVEMQRFKSAILNNERRIWVYTPAEYSPKAADPYTLLICFDGRLYLDSIPLATILDNLQAAGQIPPMVAVMIDSPVKYRRGELMNQKAFIDFLGDELIPWVRRQWNVTHDPALTVVTGVSAGGLTSGHAAFRRPDLFGNVLSQSGAFWRGPEGNDMDHEWLRDQFAASRRLPLRIFMVVGLVEIPPTPNNGPSLLEANRHLRDVLVAKEYPLEYIEEAGGHEPLSWKGTLGRGLIFFIGKKN